MTTYIGNSPAVLGLVNGGTGATALKSVNSVAITGSGDIVVQPTLVSGTSIKTINSTSLLGSGDIVVQPTLVSGTSIKTINSTSLLGSGNITVTSLGSGAAVNTISVTLTSSSAAVQTFNTPLPGRIIALPDATTMASVGANVFVFTNNGIFDVTINDASGNLLGFVSPNDTVHCHLVDKTTAAGVWDFSGISLIGRTAIAYLPGSAGTTAGVSYIDIDSNKSIVLIQVTNLYGAIYNRSTNTCGTLTLIRTGAINGMAVEVIDSTKVIVASSVPSREAVVLSISGETITVNTAAALTGSGVVSKIVKLGSSFLIIGPTALHAITVSGTTVTSGTVYTSTDMYMIEVLDTTRVLLQATTATTMIVVSVSGTTITAGTPYSHGITTSTGFVRKISYEKYVGVNSTFAKLITISGTTISATSNTLSLGNYAATGGGCVVLGTSVLLYRYGDPSIYLAELHESGGLMVLGGAISYYTASGTNPLLLNSVFNNIANLVINSSGNQGLSLSVNIVSNSPVITKFDRYNTTTATIIMPGYSNDLFTHYNTYSSSLMVGSKTTFDPTLVTTTSLIYRSINGTVMTAVTPTLQPKHDYYFIIGNKMFMYLWYGGTGGLLQKIEVV